MLASRQSTFEVIPAIDLRGGRVVRLEQGDFGRETAFDLDPVAQARRFAESGARWIHVVDLDGARAGGRRQADVIDRIRTAIPGTAVQVAGGLRDGPSIAEALAAGATRVVLGTAAIADPASVEASIARHSPERIAIALDVRDGQAVGGGWARNAPARDLGELLDAMDAIGVRTLVVTAIARDGLLAGPDLTLLGRCTGRSGSSGWSVIASGGITTLDDLRAVRRIGCAGAIVGRALYDGRLRLSEAIQAMDGGPA
ncbi:MAG TPA: 1-(5-phosphoribosyl)-5-[(5-phosphoribosylamino)methylideneamino] imidazole-4-carboxamide isomerase [Candidatus Limnocylindrales bacterium]|nr:1-(5-phosphoribosyl)-5-[(5-phosphoribosylamino)methylideneamino] imidazole-4-carboxamide isomerase [Candidatus Limnocylindrales bacterium]